MRTNIEILENLNVDHKKLKEEKPYLLFKILKAMDVARTEQLTIPVVAEQSEQLVCPNCDGEGFSGKGTNEILPCLSCFGSGERTD